MGTGHNVPGAIFTADGLPVHFPGGNEISQTANQRGADLPEHGAYNSLQQMDAHPYWEFNYLGTNWVHPLYELPFTGGFPDSFGEFPDTFEDGEIGALQSIIPGSGPHGIRNRAVAVGDNPNLPRDPDKFDGDVDAQREFRQRGIPSGIGQRGLPRRV